MDISKLKAQQSHFENLTHEMFTEDVGKDDGNNSALDLKQSAIHPYTLFYKDPRMERMFRDDLYKIPSRQLVRICVCLLFLWVISIWNTWISKEPENDDVNIAQFVVFIIGIVFIVSMFILGSGYIFKMSKHKAHSLAIIIWLFGILVALHSGYLRREMRLPVSATLMIVTLIIQHVVAKFIFVVTIGISTSTSLLYIILVLSHEWNNSRTVNVWSEIFYVIVANTALLFSSYEFEIYRRHSFAKRRQAERERDVMKDEAKMVRAEMYDYVLRNLDIADMDETDVTLDLKSPMEKAMDILLTLSKKTNTLSNIDIDLVKQVMTYLASSSDIFRPDISMQIRNNVNTIDDELQEWLYSLMEAPRIRRRTALPSNDNNFQVHSGDEDDLVETLTNIKIDSATSPNGDDLDDAKHSVDGVMEVNDNLPSMLRPKSYSKSSRHGYSFTNEENDQAAVDILINISRFEFDIFKAHEISKSHPVQFIGSTLFKDLGLMKAFNISKQKLRNFLSAIEHGYHSNPYHNSIHAADVSQTFYCYLCNSDIMSYLSDIELLAVAVAALIHDFDHPGRTNQFHINTLDKKAILYNDRAILENHHIAAAFTILLKPECNITTSLTAAQFSKFRRTVIDLVLATDLAYHFEFLGHFKQHIATRLGKEELSVDTKESREYKLMIMKMGIKCADVGHTAKPLELHKKWTDRIMEEFYQQGDEERQLGLEISPFMDRRKKNVPKSQIGFMNILVQPMYELWMDFLQVTDEQLPCLKLLKENRDYWILVEKAQNEENKKLYRVNSGSSSHTTTLFSRAQSPIPLSRAVSESQISRNVSLSRNASNLSRNQSNSKLSLSKSRSNDTTANNHYNHQHTDNNKSVNETLEQPKTPKTSSNQNVFE